MTTGTAPNALCVPCTSTYYRYAPTKRCLSSTECEAIALYTAVSNTTGTYCDLAPVVAEDSSSTMMLIIIVSSAVFLLAVLLTIWKCKKKSGESLSSDP